MLRTIALAMLFSALFACGGGGPSSPQEEADWKDAQTQNSLMALDSFLVKYPKTGLKSEIARRREGILFKIAEAENTEYHYRMYLKEFPQGKRQKTVEEKLKNLANDAISLDLLTAKTFVGSIRYLDGSQPDREVLSLRFTETSEEGDAIHFKAAVHLTADIKKVLTGTIQKPQFSIKFEENKDDEFLLELPNARAYLRNNQVVLESVDPANRQYWKLK